jgi:release factor glutamine methyltransferase
MSLSDKKIFYADCEFHVPTDVYEPAEDSFLFAENLHVEEDDVVVDVGTGCGILGIIAARKARRVFAVDVNPYALQCAIENARLNRVADKMFFVRTDLLKPIKMGQQFDVMTFNAPYLPLENEDGSWLGYAWSGGADGRQVIDRFIREAPGYLHPEGQILLMQSSLSGISETLRSFSQRGLDACVVTSRRLPFFETIVLVRAAQLKRSK